MWDVAAFYHFAPLDAPDDLRPALRALCERGGVTGTILVAPEGVNGTIAGPGAGVNAVLAHLRALPGMAALTAKFSEASEQPFKKLKVRLKREIVTMGQPQVRPSEGTGRYVPPEDWNDLIAAPDV
ncbi:MAG: hypothetical protein AAF618_06170, partial [Pseudomonadota bacterium]